MHFQNLKFPSLAIWLGTLGLCLFFALVDLGGLDPIPVMVICAVLILGIGAVVRSRQFPEL